MHRAVRSKWVFYSFAKYCTASQLQEWKVGHILISQKDALIIDLTAAIANSVKKWPHHVESARPAMLSKHWAMYVT